MPLIKSAKKSLRVSIKKKADNDLTRAKIKSALKAARLAIVAGATDANEKISIAYKELDTASKKNVIHKNKAARLKSRLMKKLAKSEAAETKPATKSPAKKTPVKKITK